MRIEEKPFRLGFIGAGAVTRELHLAGALASPHVAVTALVDPATDRAKRLAWDFGISPKIAARAEDVFDDVDGVFIATPNNTHHDIAVACFRAGKHCLVEKPLATTTEDAEAIYAAAEAAGKILAVGYTTRFRDEVLLLKQLLNEQFFGAVRRFHYQEGTVGGWTPMSGFIMDRRAAGGGVLVNTGTHFINRMLYWFGYPESCSMADDSAGGPEAHCLCTFGYRSEGIPFEGTLLLSKTVPLKAGLVMQTDRGNLVFPMGRAPLYWLPRHNHAVRTSLSPNAPRRFAQEKSDSQLEIEDFVNACRGESEPMVGGREAVQSVKLIEELYGRRQQFQECAPETESREVCVA